MAQRLWASLRGDSWGREGGLESLPCRSPGKEVELPEPWLELLVPVSDRVGPLGRIKFDSLAASSGSYRALAIGEDYV